MNKKSLLSCVCCFCMLLIILKGIGSAVDHNLIRVVQHKTITIDDQKQINEQGRYNPALNSKLRFDLNKWKCGLKLTVSGIKPFASYEIYLNGLNPLQAISDSDTIRFIKTVENQTTMKNSLKYLEKRDKAVSKLLANWDEKKDPEYKELKNIFNNIDKKLPPPVKVYLDVDSIDVGDYEIVVKTREVEQGLRSFLATYSNTTTGIVSVGVSYHFQILNSYDNYYYVLSLYGLQKGSEAMQLIEDFLNLFGSVLNN